MNVSTVLMECLQTFEWLLSRVRSLKVWHHRESVNHCCWRCSEFDAKTVARMRPLEGREPSLTLIYSIETTFILLEPVIIFLLVNITESQGSTQSELDVKGAACLRDKGQLNLLLCCGVRIYHQEHSNSGWQSVDLMVCNLNWKTIGHVMM